MRFTLLAVLWLFSTLAFGQGRIIKPQDVLEFSSRAEPSLNFQVPVNHDGSIWLPGKAFAVVAGLTVERALPSIIRSLESAGLNTAGLGVAIVGRSTATVTFDGAVLAAGGTVHRKGMKLSDIVLIASPTVAADLEHIEITDAGGATTNHKFVSFFTASGDWNVGIRPGDHVHFKLLDKASEVSVLGEVSQPGPIDFFAGITVRQAIGFANGMTGNAISTAVEVLRDGKVIDTLNLDLGYDRELQRGDIVRVPRKKNEKFIFVVGAVKREGSIDFRDGMRFTEAISLAEGLLPNANLEEIYLVRRVDGNLKRMKQNLGRIANRRDPNPILQAGDIVEINLKRPPGARSI